MKARILVVCLAAMLMAPSALAAPMPPSDLDFAPVDDGVLLSWTPPQGGTPVAYQVYRASVGEQSFLMVPYERVEAPNTSLLIEDLDSIYVLDVEVPSLHAFYVTALYAGGLESAPSNPFAFSRQADWPRCSVIGWGISPPSVLPKPGCLLPPPV